MYWSADPGPYHPACSATHLVIAIGRRSGQAWGRDLGRVSLLLFHDRMYNFVNVQESIRLAILNKNAILPFTLQSSKRPHGRNCFVFY